MYVLYTHTYIYIQSLELVISLIHFSSNEDAKSFRSKTIWMMTVFDILSLCAFTSCVKVSSNLLETRSFGTEFSKGLEDARASVLISDDITKSVFSDMKPRRDVKI